MFDESIVSYVFSADVLRVSDGVARGDALADCADLILDDVYQFARDAVPIDTLGSAGHAPIHPKGQLIFMTLHGALVEITVFADINGRISFAPESQLKASDRYRLIAVTPIDESTATMHFRSPRRAQFQSV